MNAAELIKTNKMKNFRGTIFFVYCLSFWVVCISLTYLNTAIKKAEILKIFY